MCELIFSSSEYERLADGQIRLNLKTVLQKLPDPQQLKFSPLPVKEDADRLLQQLVEAGVQQEILNHWLTLNFQQIRQKTRNVGVYFSLLTNLNRLRLKYGTEPLTTALLLSASYSDPRKCNLAYIKAILRNGITTRKPTSCKTTTPSNLSAPPSCASEADAEEPTEMWERVKAYVADRRGEDPWYNTWLRPTRQHSQTIHTLTIAVPDPVYAFELNTTPIRDILQRLGWKGDLQFEVVTG